MRHVAGVDVDTEVPAAKMITAKDGDADVQGLAEAPSTKSD